jgi:hypothetical protein
MQLIISALGSLTRVEKSRFPMNSKVYQSSFIDPVYMLRKCSAFGTFAGILKETEVGNKSDNGVKTSMLATFNYFEKGRKKAKSPNLIIN